MITVPSSEVMHKYKKGTLRSSSGAKVKSREQAIAIMMSEKRNEKAHGGHYKESEPMKKLLHARERRKK